MENALVSIALCTYNGEKYLIEQLDTLVKQSYTNLEIIAVDDCSTDGTVAILKQYEAKHPNFRVYQNDQNLGYIKNFEKAIFLCNGDYIALSDQDDIWDLNKIRIMANAIADSLFLYHDSAFITENGESMNRKMSDIRNFYQGSDSRVFLLENCVSGHAMFFKRELLSVVGTFDTSIFHDWWLVYAASNNGKVNYILDCLVKYRQHTQANTNILRLDRKQIKKRDSLLQIEKEQQRIKIFATYSHNDFQLFKNRMLRFVTSRMTSYFSFSLALFIFLHRSKLLFIQRKTSLSKMNYIFKYAWGYRLKQGLK